MSGKSKKRQLVENSPSSPVAGNGPPVTNEMIFQQLIEMRADINNSHTRIEENSKSISVLEEENKRLRLQIGFLEKESLAYKIRIIDFSPSSDYAAFKTKVMDILNKTANVESSAVRRFQQFPSRDNKKRIGLITFIYADHVDTVCKKRKEIYEKYQCQVARELSHSQRSEMQCCIDNAIAGKENSKITINLAIPVAYVDNVCVWPPNQRRRAGISYAMAVSTETPANIYTSKSVDPSKAIKISIAQDLVVQSAPPTDGSEFIGLALHWDGKTEIKEVVNGLIWNGKIAFSIDEKDNVMHAAVSLMEGHFYRFSLNDSHEKGASTDFLKLMAKHRVTNVALIIFRKYGGTHLGPRRFEIYRDIAAKLLDNLDTSSNG